MGSGLWTAYTLDNCCLFIGIIFHFVLRSGLSESRSYQCMIAALLRAYWDG